MKKKGPIAVFTALRWEAQAVTGALSNVRAEHSKVWRGLAGDSEVLVVAGGIGPARARRAVEAFAAHSLRAVISAGCAGALRRESRVGELVLAREVKMYAGGGDGAMRSFGVDDDLWRAAKEAAGRARLATAEGPLFTSERVLFTPTEKARCRRDTGAVAVEMESGVHAAFATEVGAPFLALRVILDRLDTAIPDFGALLSPKGGGRIKPLRVAGLLLSRPRQVAAIWALGRARRRAAVSLRAVFASLFPLL